MTRVHFAWAALAVALISSNIHVHASSPVQVADQLLCDLACVALDPGSNCYCKCRTGSTIASLPLGHCGVDTISAPHDEHTILGWPQTFGNETTPQTSFDESVEAHSPPPANNKQVKFSAAKVDPSQLHLAATTKHGQVNSGSVAVYKINDHDGIGKGTDRYVQWGGNPANFPPKSKWVSFVDMFNANKPLMFSSCAQYHQANDDGPEVGAIWDAIQEVAAETYVDHRFILAIVLQESGGCVRVPTSNYGVRNPGLMQDHNGDATCNSDITKKVQNPCPKSEILQMIRDGTAGTVRADGKGGDGLAQCINQSGERDTTAFYKAARIYNSGSWAGCAECGVATHCYVSDVVNRLTGWVSAPHHCTFDK